MLTDRNGDFDAGAILMVVVTVYMCISSGYGTFILKQPFNAFEFGGGIASMLGGFGLYKWGDARGLRRDTYQPPRRTRVDIVDDR